MLNIRWPRGCGREVAEMEGTHGRKRATGFNHGTFAFLSSLHSQFAPGEGCVVCLPSQSLCGLPSNWKLPVTDGPQRSLRQGPQACRGSDSALFSALSPAVQVISCYTVAPRQQATHAPCHLADAIALTRARILSSLLMLGRGTTRHQQTKKFRGGGGARASANPAAGSDLNFLAAPQGADRC